MVCSGVVVVSRIVHEVIMAMTKELHANIRCAQCSHFVANGQFTNTRFACIFAQPNEVANGDGQTNPIPRHVVDSRGLWFLCTRAV